MTENYLAVMLNVGLLLVLICLSKVSNVGAQTVPTCDVNSITIKDPVTGSVQCQDCLKCPAGEGLSVDCGAVISSKMPLVCKACVLGETYSPRFETGTCKDCENCNEHRETIKACTLTSKAVCGNCKIGAYVEPMLGMCKPCSPCCNDDKDIRIPECQVGGVPKDMQCSYARSLKCSKVMAKASVSTATPTETNHSKVPSTAVVNSYPSEPLTKLPYDASTPRPGLIAGSVIGGVVVVFILPLAIIIRCCMVKRRKAHKKTHDLARVESEIGERQARHVQDNDQTGDDTQMEQDRPMNKTVGQDLDSAVNLLEGTGPVQRGPDESRPQTGNGTDDPSGLDENSTGTSSLPIQESGTQGQAGNKTAVGLSEAVQESGDGNQEQTGTKEPRPPHSYDFKFPSTFLQQRHDQGPTSEPHGPAKVCVELKVQVDVPSSSKSVMV